MKKKKRVRESDRERLKDLKEHDAVVEAYDDKDADDLNYDDVLEVVLPEPSEETIMERPEDEMVFINLHEDRGIFDRINQLAGENVSSHEVIHQYVNEFEEDL